MQKALDIHVPRELEDLLKEANGGLYFYEKEQYNTEKIMDVFRELESKQDGLIPFCSDSSSMLVVDTTRGNAVFEWDLDDQSLSDAAISPSLADFMEEYRNALVANKCEYIRDVGVVEKVGASRK
jgi:SMI1-KNR4 cell-wall